MSGDESDGPEKSHPASFRIVEARWQSLELKTFLRALDGMYREDWANPQLRRAVSGNPSRHRIEEGARIEDGIAPRGLWRNCYDHVWLTTLKPYIRWSLHVIDEDYDFSIKDTGSP